MRKAIHTFAGAAVALLMASPAFAKSPRLEPAKSLRPEPAKSLRAEPAAPASSPDDDTGFTLGLRGAWGMPLGTLGASAQLSDVTAGNIPLWLEAGYRFNRNVSAGVFLQDSRGFSAHCPNQADCSTSDTRFGVQVAYSFLPSSTFSPWVGLGAGYEILRWSRAGAERSASGIEYGNLQLGADWIMNSHSSVGPFANMTFGKFSSQSSGGVSTVYTDAGIHNWLQLGLRLSYKI